MAQLRKQFGPLLRSSVHNHLNRLVLTVRHFLRLRRLEPLLGQRLVQRLVVVVELLLLLLNVLDVGVAARVHWDARQDLLAQGGHTAFFNRPECWQRGACRRHHLEFVYNFNCLSDVECEGPE